MPANRKPRHRQRQVLKRYPMMRPLRDQISLDMHLALSRLRTAPHDDARTDLAATFNTVSVAIENDARFAEERHHLLAGALCLQDYHRARLPHRSTTGDARPHLQRHRHHSGPVRRGHALGG